MINREKHKHAGVMGTKNEKTYQRLHPISVVHKSKNATMFHNLELVKFAKESKKEQRKKPVEKAAPMPKIKTTQKADLKPIVLQIDNDGYISMDLDKANVKGVRLTFTRREHVSGTKKRTVALEIDKIPFKLGSGERLSNKRLTIAEKY